jgi:hypothetical protein
MATTLDQITDEFYNIVAEPNTSNVFPLAWVQNLANTVQREICRSWRFPFIRTKMLFNTGVDTTADGAIATTDVTIDVGATTGFESSGAAFIENDIVNYTGTTSTSLTGVTNIDIAHVTGSDVEFLKALPSDYSHLPDLFVKVGNNSPLREFHYVLDDLYEVTDIRKKYTFVTDKNSVQYIRMANQTSSQIAVFNYYKIPATMTSSVDATIPDEFALSVLPRVMAGVAKIIRDDDVDNIGSIIKQIGESEILEMKRYYSMREGAEGMRLRSKYKSRPWYSNKYGNRRYNYR